MAKLKDIISLIERVENKSILKEGIDIDYQNQTVSYNPSHQDNVDTSLENNPTVSTEYGNNINVYSIFKRKNDSLYDGNPLLYALKNEKNWKFASDRDKEDIITQIRQIAKKFNSMYQGGFTILIPSSNYLNQFIGNILKETGNNTIIAGDVLLKLTTDEVIEAVLMKDSPFIQYYGDRTNDAIKLLGKYIERMNREKNGVYIRHYVLDSTMRNLISKTIKASEEAIAKYSKYIENEDILIIDDSISRGDTIKEACEILQNTYSPKSITVLTLFSKLY